MYIKPGPLAPCPKEFAPGSWASKSMGQWTLPLTMEAQREIYANQNPEDCSKAKYLVYHVVPNGVGAVIHVAGVALQIALDLQRVYVEASGTFLTDSPQCGDSRTLDSCYFLPFSKCKPTAAQLRDAPHLASTRGKEQSDKPVLTVMHDAIVEVRAQAPLRFLERLNQTDMDPRKWYYWWRAQAAAYMLRPNEATLKEIERRKKTMIAGPAPAPGCISVHVRHGDKGVEAQTFDDQVYDKTAAKLHGLDPDRFSDRLWVSTEDPSTISYFATNGTTAAGNKWQTGYIAGTPRKPDRNKANLAYMAEIGYYEEVLNALTNLDLALECDGFVGSIYSNWVRLIDEMRSTIRCKADAVFVDVVYDSPHAMDVNW
ncbi:hypothetical protein HXX76_011453 [Chlamydomonas incerta]|uniref:Alpha-(1,6)-fucosyltransferase N- and catalytic domain-containing protein n=1 Tax=Chlamydomonas incerta TaxID=51695 RepID=A0A835SZH4_CHLIN|nr:hypothetical protein HXX76_011453 [Chlamydomonas incerta]|eukprot:KAG2428751.1 hypothetical protein HXX76_011453 [Chlamydomonas incerta]